MIHEVNSPDDCPFQETDNDGFPDGCSYDCTDCGDHDSFPDDCPLMDGDIIVRKE